ncbi:MAG: N-acyl-D-amino-acid deacylase family protein [Phenylobacterium sp.]
MSLLYDLVLRDAQVIDGSGSPAYEADIGISGDRISFVGRDGDVRGAKDVPARGLAVAPGFIDVHSHDDNALLIDRAMAAKVTQGVTSVVAGNCGVSLAPLVTDDPPAPLNVLDHGDAPAFRFTSFKAYVQALEAHPAAVNAALLVGHSTLRASVMDDLSRPATAAEAEAMADILDAAMESGAIGLSSGLWYPPANAATMREVVRVLQPVHRRGGIYTTHMRNEDDDVATSLEESFETARQAKTPLVVSHHKCMGAANFGRSVETLGLIDEAASRQDVSFDAYPYTAGSSALLIAPILKSSKVTITWSDALPNCSGRDLDDLAAEWEVDRLEAAQRLMPGGAIYHMMDEADVSRILAHPGCMIGSDGLPHDAFPHPRLWGTFPRVLGHYVRERKLFTLEEAVRRMTSLPAERFGLQGRGRVAVGAYADLVVFDPAEIDAMATFEEPTRPAKGVRLVMVNGQIVYQDNQLTSARPGRVLTRIAA